MSIKFNIRSAAIVLTTIFFGCTVGVSQYALAQPVSARRGCEPIGRVLSKGDRYFTAGTLLCKGDRLNLKPEARVNVLCFLNRRMLTLLGGSISDVENKCVSTRTQRIRLCSQEDRSYCPKPKGPGEENNTPELISPFSSASLTGRPFLSWYAVPKASSYTVRVDGQGQSWEKTVAGTELPYPSEQPALKFGNAYKITITANQGNSASSPISASTAVVNVLPESEVRQVMQAVKQINSLNLPKDEVAFLDLDSIYMSKNLLSETIKALEARIKEGSQNPAIYRVLGDRYLEAGLPDRAKPKYEIASKLARKTANSTELARAQAGLEQVRLY